VSEDTTKTYTAPSEWDCWHEPDPRCPFCGDVMKDAYELGSLQRDDDTTEVECDNCEHTYKVTLHIEYSYTTALVVTPPAVEAGSK
jgi:hypothetical protein